jgi:hypothetical protein
MRDVEVNQLHRVRASHEVRYFTLGGAIPAAWLLLGYVEYFGFTLATRAGDESVASRMYAGVIGISVIGISEFAVLVLNTEFRGGRNFRRFAIDPDLRF